MADFFVVCYTGRMPTISIKSFQKMILDHYKKYGRALPWRETNDPYAILVSEVMLQQTQVDRVIPKYLAWLQRFPTFQTLAQAPLPTILKMWQGLGYNRRAINLQRLAKIVVEKYGGKLPQDPALIDELPGIGSATAGSIATYAFNHAAPFIETNVRAVFIHFFFRDQENVSDNDLLPLVTKATDTRNPRRWYNALMDYGVKLKKEFKNPTRRSKHHTTQSRFEGSNRQLRGRIIKLLLENPELTSVELGASLNKTVEVIELNLAQLAKEGFTMMS